MRLYELQHQVMLDESLIDKLPATLKTAIKNYMQSTDSKYRKHFERFLKLDWRELGSINTVALLTRQELLDRGFDPDNINHPLLKLKE